jgi:hypothetical protein
VNSDIVINVILWLLGILFVRDFLVYWVIFPPIGYVLESRYENAVGLFGSTAVTFALIYFLSHYYAVDHPHLIAGIAAAFEAAYCLIWFISAFFIGKVDQFFLEFVLKGFVRLVGNFKVVATAVFVAAWMRTVGYPI